MSARRLRSCVEAWPEAETMGYDPRCCRFPKSCSAGVWDERYVTEDHLEATRRPVSDEQAPGRTETHPGRPGAFEGDE